MNPENAIEVRNITKSFKVYLDKGHTLKELTLFRKRRQYETRIVLNGISFDVKKGEAIGLIGQNGCGKSTTLKLLTRIMYPDSGTIEMRGRVSSLIELGAGFHPDMSGRQNIYTNASIFGLTRKEIDQRVNDIIAFSELEEFIDNPVRTYSSGMYMRLAFAVAINVDADILLIDEILAVGDAAFQAKCFEYLFQLKRKGTTIVIVSHSMGQIEQICDRSIWLDNGKIQADGAPKLVDEEYLYHMESKRLEAIEKEKRRKREENIGRVEQREALPADAGHSAEVLRESVVVDESEDHWINLRGKIPSFADPTAIRMGTGEIEFTDAQMLDADGNETNVFSTGDDIIIKMYYHTQMKYAKGNFGIGIFREDNVHCYGTNIVIESDKRVDVSSQGIVEVTLCDCPLLPGKYYLDIAVHGDYGYFYDDIRRVTAFYMKARKMDVGVARIKTRWKFEQA